MRWMILAAASIAAITLAHADTPNEAQSNVMKHTADAYVLAERCPKMEVDTSMVYAMALFHGIPADAYSPGGAFEGAITRSFERARREIGTMSGDAACVAAMLMFGPTGGNVPNLMRRR